jgi:hypothetical protein
VVLAQRGEVDGEVMRKPKGVAVVFAQNPPRPGEDILIQITELAPLTDLA